MILRESAAFAMDGEAPRSQASMAYEAIRADILSGRLLPERKLKIQELAARLDVSPGAVREALSRLVPENLAVMRDQRGFVVAPLSIPDLNELTDLRCEIEAIALRRSVARGDAAWEAGILAAEHRLSGGPIAGADGEGTKREWVQSHAAFHLALVSACGSRRLLALHAQLYEQSERYRGLSFHVEGDRDVGGEHRRIVEHALARDADALVAAMTHHLKTTTALIVAAYAGMTQSG